MAGPWWRGANIREKGRTMKRGNYNNLAKGSVDRMIARIAARANSDTLWGGARALVIVRRAQAMGLPHADEMEAAVGDTYSASLGHVPDDYAVVACPECGQWHLGVDHAAACCADVFGYSDSSDE